MLMDETRRSFCEKTVSLIENKVTLMLHSIDAESPCEYDETEARAVRTLVETRDMLLAEAVAYEEDKT